MKYLINKDPISEEAMEAGAIDTTSIMLDKS